MGVHFWVVVCLRGDDSGGQTHSAKWPLLTTPATVFCHCVEIVAPDSLGPLAEGMEGLQEQLNTEQNTEQYPCQLERWIVMSPPRWRRPRRWPAPGPFDRWRAALKKAAGPGIAKDKRASSGRQRPGTFSGAAKSPVSLRRKSRSRCHGPVRRRLNSLMPQSRRLSREFHRSRRCPKPVVVASGRRRRRCGGTCRRFSLFL